MVHVPNPIAADYVGGTWHLNWKLYQLNNLKVHTIPAYRETLG